MVVLLMLACSGSGDNGDKFFSSDGRYTPPEWGTSSSDDTAATDTADTGSSEGDPGAPVFTDIEGSWEVYTEIDGAVLQVMASYTDDGDDIVDGNCYIDVTFGDSDANFDGSIGTDKSAACVATGGTFVFALQGLDDSIDTHVEFQAQDTSGNVSALYPVDVAGE